MKKNYSASITVFLSLSFVLIAALILTITESARTIAQKYYMQTALNSAMESLFSEFHRPLWENYRIYALEFRDDNLLKEELQSFIKPYSDARNLFPAKIEKDGFSFTGRGLLSESHYFEEEILEYMPALLAKDCIEFLGEKKSGTDIPSILEEASKKEKEADSIQRLQEKYALNHYDVEYLEDCINNIDRFCKKTETLKHYALYSLQAHDASLFFSYSSSLKATLNSLKNTVNSYDARAELLKSKVEALWNDFSTEKENLEEDGIAAIETQLKSYDNYLDDGGRVRQKIDGFPAQCENLDFAIEGIEENVRRFQEYIEEERERRRKRKKEEEDYDEDNGLQAEIDNFYNDTISTWQALTMPVYGEAVTQINKKNKRILESIHDIGKKKLLELLLPSGKECPSSEESFSSALFSTESAANPIQIGLLGEYSLRFFHSYHKEESAHTTPYSNAKGLEVEYLLHGKKSDYENLSAQVTSLLAFRESMNFIHIMSDPEKLEAVEEFVTSFLAITANPVVIAVFSAFVIGIWAFAQSLLDVKELLNDERVPLMHSLESWTLSLNHLLDFLSYLSGEEIPKENIGLSYEDYLRISLFTKGLLSQAKINDSMLYCMEKNIQTSIRDKEPSFQINKCLYYLSTDAEIYSRHSLYHKGFLEMIGVNAGEEGYQSVLHSDYKYKNLSH
ncbi:hypothetical protein HMPREF9624_01261 [Oribacterium asaccharolyticum ACB7]|uniref:Uncharacterized protein n=1 Tax=Oribacterium asaccharolyticum ACB7 TaxID=796944 RepID=G9WWH7_9FIRM|nr:DUF5702 domain-containing protein [Oribacterium asaccharolyticum]EHL09846.1 hypothetical protein HMPREF9624_01261 [Oribacterium asaccharolyticum ACB7]